MFVVVIAGERVFLHVPGTLIYRFWMTLCARNRFRKVCKKKNRSSTLKMGENEVIGTICPVNKQGIPIEHQLLRICMSGFNELYSLGKLSKGRS